MSKLNITQEEKTAVKLALNQQWEEAITVNSKILDEYPENVKARTRLGLAYLQTKEFAKAEEAFREVLKKDPINKVAIKNLDLAKSKKSKKNSESSVNIGQIKEPGTTIEAKVLLTAKNVTANSFTYGDKFKLSILKTKVNLTQENKIVGELLDTNIVSRLNICENQNGTAEATFIKGDKKDIVVLVKSSIPVFKGQKQDVKPYMKKGSIEEPEIEIDDFGDEDE